ncbi:hypothetical protein NDU88_005080 [Pleurodeles waltl]|uniref:Uncharacterized protein n=1 Tax=Pleurodeles waltl TaxID=8319 RepID=A0AAV7TAB3_PLEWA|nr:hypothetical protein NDU88_005080 [Pleurodeles waltl]
MEATCSPGRLVIDIIWMICCSAKEPLIMCISLPVSRRVPPDQRGVFSDDKESSGVKLILFAVNPAQFLHEKQWSLEHGYAREWGKHRKAQSAGNLENSTHNRRSLFSPRPVKSNGR